MGHVKFQWKYEKYWQDVAQRVKTILENKNKNDVSVFIICTEQVSKACLGT